MNSGLRLVLLMKKNGGGKSRATVPLIHVLQYRANNVQFLVTSQKFIYNILFYLDIVRFSCYLECPFLFIPHKCSIHVLPCKCLVLILLDNCFIFL
jgi:hypothetical protein